MKARNGGRIQEGIGLFDAEEAAVNGRIREFVEQLDVTESVGAASETASVQ